MLCASEDPATAPLRRAAIACLERVCVAYGKNHRTLVYHAKHSYFGGMLVGAVQGALPSPHAFRVSPSTG